MHTMNAIYIIGRRDVIRWWRNKPAILGSLTFPLLFLLVFGSGLSGAMGSLTNVPGAENGVAIDFKQFIFPGVIAMNLLMNTIYNSVSVVADREFGILKEVLVAPISRISVAIGKTFGVATMSTLQASLAFIIAPLAGIRLTPMLLLQAIPVMFLAACAMSAMCVAIASRMRYSEGFQAFMQFLAFPMVFLSGIFFPLVGLPIWLEAIVKINPVSYAVDPIRRLVLAEQGLTPDVMDQLANFGLAMGLFGHQLTLWQDLMIIAVFGTLMILLAMGLFSIQD